MLLAQAVAFAQLAGVPPVSGLYTAAVPMLVYSALASSTKVNSTGVGVACVRECVFACG